MNSNLHELVFLLDQSTEIKDQIEEAQKGFKNLIVQQKKASYNTNVTLNVFGNDYWQISDGLPIQKFKTEKELFPLSGVCTLLDSAAKTVDDVGVRLCKTNENDRPSKVIVVLVTYGRDNASKKYTYPQLAEMIKHQTEVYKWTFLLLTDFSINMEKLNIPEENTIIVKKREKNGFTDAYAELNKRITEIRNQ